MKLTGKTIIITGAAGGLGAALARRFDKEAPEALLLLDIDGAGLETLAAELKCHHTSFALCDVSNPLAVTEQVRAMEQRYGRVDLYCANAGVFTSGGIDSPLEQWQHSLDINLMSHLYAVQACLPNMLARGAGYFLHTISAAGLLSQIGSAPYTVSKHAAVGLAEWVAITHGAEGIGVTALCPQGVNTAMLNNISSLGSVASDGLLSPEEVADCALQAIDAETFLALPHPRVADYVGRKAKNHDRWIHNMQRFKNQLQEPSGERL